MPLVYNTQPQEVPVPIGVEDGGRVSTEERDLVGGSAAFVDGNDSKGATTTGFPVDCDVFWVGLRYMSVYSWRSRVRIVFELTLIRLVSQAFLEMRRLS